MNLTGYDFVDFGASKGGCIEFAIARLGGRRGLGIDIDPTKVKQMIDRGYECIQGDITKLEFPPDSVRFVTMSHVLEHLPDISAVRKAIQCAAYIASDFLFIQGPYFDADEFLREDRLKFFWSDWRGHKCHLTTRQLRDILVDLGLSEHVIMAREIVKDSSDPAIHLLDSPIDQHEYVAGGHPEKPFVAFDPALYKEIVCCVQLRPMPNWKGIIGARKGCQLLEAKDGV